ncbi:SagB/ThcOx family dehydrogenase [Chloroflexota bacterium]
MSTVQPSPIHLPPPSQTGDISLEEAIVRRRSIRRFTASSISQSQLSQILWASQGVTNAASGQRAAPSAGATYPLEIFVICGTDSVEGIGEGIYHYNPENHSLTLKHKGDVRLELAGTTFDQEYICEAPVDIIICAVYARTMVKYEARGERYVHMDVGHAGQNIYLQATTLGLATVAMGAFHDEHLREVLRLDEHIRPLYIMPVGKAA